MWRWTEQRGRCAEARRELGAGPPESPGRLRRAVRLELSLRAPNAHSSTIQYNHAYSFILTTCVGFEFEVVASNFKIILTFFNTHLTNIWLGIIN